MICDMKPPWHTSAMSSSLIYRREHESAACIVRILADANAAEREEICMCSIRCVRWLQKSRGGK